MRAAWISSRMILRSRDSMDGGEVEGDALAAAEVGVGPQGGRAHPQPSHHARDVRVRVAENLRSPPKAHGIHLTGMPRD